jgi:tetratricopeptide (TPR) repeat protein
MTDILPPIERRLDLLAGALDRARRYDTGFIAFVIYRAESARALFESALVNRLTTLHQRARRVWFQPDSPPASHDLMQRLLEAPPNDDEVIFVYGLQHAFPGLLNALNYRRELIPDRRWRLVFWALDDEATRMMRDAPDFWAFVNQVHEVPEVPPPEERAEATATLAWGGFSDSEIRNLAPDERRARIALRERLLDELPESEETQSTRANLHYTLAWLYWADGQLPKAEEHAQMALALAQQLDDVWLHAGVMNGLGAIYAALPTGDQTINLMRAIECYEKALHIVTPEAAPSNYATTQNNLGNAYRDLPTGDRAENLARAILCYEEALRFRTPETAPLDYAMTQNNLGNAYLQLPTGNRAENLMRAIAYYEKALRSCTPEAAPFDYAGIQHNLGLAYTALPTGDRAANLARAIACYEETLRFRTPEDTPLDYARTQNNLGNAYSNLPAGDRAVNLHRAIKCYEEALSFYTPETVPLDYANTQYRLGTVYYELEQLEQAAEAYRRAVEITPENGSAQTALSSVLRKLGHEEEAAIHLARARELLPDDDHYNHACLEAIGGNADAALDHLEKAIAWDATLRDWAARDPDLEPLRGNPRFEAIVQMRE